jgi:hypothetical protein
MMMWFDVVCSSSGILVVLVVVVDAHDSKELSANPGSSSATARRGCRCCFPRASLQAILYADRISPEAQKYNAANNFCFD